MKLLDSIATLCFLLDADLIIVCAAVVAGVATESTELIGRIANILFIFIFDDYFFEQIVGRIIRLPFMQ